MVSLVQVCRPSTYKRMDLYSGSMDYLLNEPRETIEDICVTIMPDFGKL
jgi:hypothetical protein